MKVNLEFYEHETLITFKQKDFTNIDDVISIGYAMANHHCFEAGILLSAEFKQFIDSLQPRKSYAIIVGHDQHDKPFVHWGALKSV